MCKTLFLALLLIPFLSSPIFAQSNQETLVLETYYPAPYGVYREMRAQRMAIGDSYYDSTIRCWEGGSCGSPIPDADNVDLIVEGKVGIGPISYGGGKPRELLQVGDLFTFYSGGWKGISYNTYLDPGPPWAWRRITADEAATIFFTDAGHVRVLTAPLGIADSLISDGTTNNWIDTAYFGNDGNVGIGISSPGARLEVAGQVKITGGDPGAGKVLTSDDTGLASWQTPTTTLTNVNSTCIQNPSCPAGKVFVYATAYRPSDGNWANPAYCCIGLTNCNLTTCGYGSCVQFQGLCQ